MRSHGSAKGRIDYNTAGVFCLNCNLPPTVLFVSYLEFWRSEETNTSLACFLRMLRSQKKKVLQKQGLERDASGARTRFCSLSLLGPEHSKEQRDAFDFRVGFNRSAQKKDNKKIDRCRERLNWHLARTGHRHHHHTPADRAGETERATPVSVYRSGRRVGPADPAVPTATPFSRPRGPVVVRLFRSGHRARPLRTGTSH
jgi:hypothetical protein